MGQIDRYLVEYFKMEMRFEKEHQERWKANHIEFDNYFKYSGYTEEPVLIERNKCTIKIKTDDPMVEFFHDNPDYSMKDIGNVFGCSPGTIKKALDKYYWAHQINKYKENKYESRIKKHNAKS